MAYKGESIADVLTGRISNAMSKPLHMAKLYLTFTTAVFTTKTHKQAVPTLDLHVFIQTATIVGQNT